MCVCGCVCVCVCVGTLFIYLFYLFIGTVTVVKNQVLSEHMVEVHSQNQGSRNPSRSRDGTEGGWSGGEHQTWDTGPQNQVGQRGGDVRIVARRSGISGGGERGDALSWVGDGQV
jgi:hypothetical protein